MLMPEEYGEKRKTAPTAARTSPTGLSNNSAPTTTTHPSPSGTSSTTSTPSCTIPSTASATPPTSAANSPASPSSPAVWGGHSARPAERSSATGPKENNALLASLNTSPVGAAHISPGRKAPGKRKKRNQLPLSAEGRCRRAKLAGEHQTMPSASLSKPASA